MKQIEVTVQLMDELEIAIQKLESQGFKKYVKAT